MKKPNKVSSNDYNTLLKKIRINLITELKTKQINLETLSRKTGYEKKFLKQVCYELHDPGISVLFSIADVIGIKYPDLFK